MFRKFRKNQCADSLFAEFDDARKGLRRAYEALNASKTKTEIDNAVYLIMLARSRLDLVLARARERGIKAWNLDVVRTEKRVFFWYLKQKQGVVNMESLLIGINSALIFSCAILDTFLRRPVPWVADRSGNRWESFLDWSKVALFGIRGGVLLFFVRCYDIFLAFMLTHATETYILSTIDFRFSWWTGYFLAAIIPTLILLPWILRMRNFLLEKRPWLEYLGRVAVVMVAAGVVDVGLKWLAKS